MCGIFGYVGNKQAMPILVEGLQTLEYRGYDSAGIYVAGAGVTKAVGPIANLETKLNDVANAGNAGIAHTRWATHGPPTEMNAHPHKDASHGIWLVHNGIIENYRELRDELIGLGHTFESDTDSEVLAALIGSRYAGDLSRAVRDALSRVRGTYGIAVMAEDTPDTIVVARLGSPIVLGVSSDAHFVSSDPSALLAHTKNVVYLEDGEVAIVTASAYDVLDGGDGSARSKSPQTIEWDIESVQKQGYDHFMLKEINEAPEVIENTLRGRLLPADGNAKLGGVEDVLDRLANLDRLTITACGSAYLAGYVGKYLLEEYANLPVDLELASEYRYKAQPLHGKSALLAITQSGETADTLAAVRRARELDLLTLGVVNVVGSTIARETDAGVYNHAGPEVAVASTKAFISQLVVMELMTLLLGRTRGMSKKTGKEIIDALTTLPDAVRTVLQQTEHIRAVAQKYAHYRDAMFIGRNSSTPIAYEGALKLKEITYIHAEAYAGGELKHGSIAMLDESFPVIALAPQDAVYEKMVSNIEEVKARSAPVLAIATEGDEQIRSLVDDTIFIPKVHHAVQPILLAIPLHLFAYYVGVTKGLNVDRPRNLAKSVTVE